MLLALQVLGSPAIGGAMIAALLIPHVVAAPLVGLVVDRARRPRWILAGLLLTFAVSLGAAALLLGRGPLWLIFAMLLAGGCCGPAITGGLTSQLPSLVGAQRTPRAFGLDSLCYNVAGVAGPAIAGIASAAAGPRTGQYLLAAFAALGALGVAALPIPPHLGGPPDSRPDLLSGSRVIVRSQTLLAVTVGSTLSHFGLGGLAVLAAVLATSHHRPASSGLLLAALAAGSFAGSLLWTWRPIAAERSPMISMISMIGIGIPIAIAAGTHALLGIGALFAVSGLFLGPYAAALFSTRTHYAPAEVRTQVFTIGAGLKITASAFGAALLGLAAGLPGWLQLLLVASTSIVGGVVGTLWLAMGPEERRSADEPARQEESRLA
jgi:MFS family permease